MVLAMVGIRTVAGGDDALVPAPALQRNGIRYEAADGDDVMFAVATGVEASVQVGGKRETVLNADSIRATVFCGSPSSASKPLGDIAI